MDLFNVMFVGRFFFNFFFFWEGGGYTYSLFVMGLKHGAIKIHEDIKKVKP